ncbi:MAG: 6-phosphogluconolactonase [Actinomycetota bacterium]
MRPFATRSRTWRASERRSRLELRVVEDLAQAGSGVFLETAPRTVALAGGATPRPVYEELARHPEAWDEVDVFFGDERCVAPEDPASNLAMANEAVLWRVSARVHPMRDCDPDAYERELASVFGITVPRFDLIFLGLGSDGHTASLFPGDPAVEVTDRNVVRVERADHPRLTLTIPVLSAAGLAVFLVSGAEKEEALVALLAGADIPAARVAAERVIVLADAAAAGATVS